MWNKKPFIIVLSAPSGTGKTTICREIIKRDRNVEYSISITTRPLRVGERDGFDYFFIDQEIFLQKIKNNEFLEYAEVFGYYYGTPISNVEKAFSKNKEIIMDLDVSGARSIKKKYPDDSITIFLVPPNIDELQKRLITRNRDPVEVINERIKKAIEEIEFYRYYDYLVINDDIDKSVNDVLSILKAERLKVERIKEVEWIKQLQ